jgi:hypothetical protein
MTRLNANEFEREVADLYRGLGAEVRHDVTIAGSQIDILATETTASGSPIKRLIECKAYSSQVGIDAVRSFIGTARLLRERHLADVATIVSASGFSRPARDAAEEFGIELLEVADLRQRADRAPLVEKPPPAPVSEAPDAEVTDSSIRAFVALPFTARFDDVYLYGIRSAAEEAGISVERADDVLKSVEIIAYVRERIQSCDLLIADTSESNPNVFYELGYADGLGKPVVLIAEKETATPFDVRGRRHLLYDGIRDLEARLPHFLRPPA